MKFSQFKRVLKEDLAKSNEPMPKWVDTLLQPINLFIENVALALQNRLSFTDNFYCKEVSVKLTSDVEAEVNPLTAFAPSARAYGVLVLSSENQSIAHMKWRNKTNGNVGLTVTFVSATEATCALLILLR